VIYDDDGGGLSPIAKKLLLLGVVVIGVPLLALGIGALLGGKSAEKKRKKEEEKQEEEAARKPEEGQQAAPPAPARPEPVVAPPATDGAPPTSSLPEPPASSSPEPAEPPASSTPDTEEAPQPTAPEEPAPETPQAAEPPKQEPKVAPPEPVAAPKVAKGPVEELPVTLPVAPKLKPTGTAPAEVQEGVTRESVLQTLTMLMSENTEVRPDSEEVSLEDRRQAVRLRVEFPVQVRATSVSEATAIDLSLTGVRLKVSSPLLIGENCHISLPGQPDQEVAATVQWCISGDSGASRAGLRFTDTPEKLTHSWVVDHLIVAGLQESQLSQKRRWIRVHTEAAVVVRDEKEQEFEATMLDLGVGGARIRTKARLKGKEGVRLVIPTGKKRTAIALSASVVGSRGDEHHLQFLPPGKGLQKRLETYILELLKPS